MAPSKLALVVQKKIHVMIARMINVRINDRITRILAAATGLDDMAARPPEQVGTRSVSLQSPADK